MQAANPQASAIRAALAEALERLGDRFDREILLAKRQQSENLNQIIRRVRQSDGEKSWSDALADGASSFAARCVVAAAEEGRFRILASRGLTMKGAAEPVVFSGAAAFATAVESAEPVVALRGPRELSPPLMSMLGNPEGGRCFLFPVASGERVAAVLYADAEVGEPDSSCLEILAAAAGAVLPGVSARWKKQAGLVEIGPAAGAPVNGEARRIAKAARTWDELPRAEREVHLRAQRMARARVAGYLLYHKGAVARGRAEKNLYGQIREQIESGREEFRKEFLEGCPSMVDYFHLELMSRIANNDAELLGPDYPGPMVPDVAVPDRVG
ncbi:MAG TPA: hypothetical protein VHD76_00045 [Bryobacteraceae bacterium]|jgi:hypothetical protein|nr:hypothetical protein [Bryobacteraceae bacterium]